MSELKDHVMEMAMKRYRMIYPCASRCDFSECFTIEGNRLFFWFNTEDDSTHVMCVEM